MMQFLPCFVFLKVGLLASVAALPLDAEITPMIVGGDLVDISDYPRSTSAITISAGSNAYSTGGQVRSASAFYWYDNYDDLSPNLDYNYGLIRLGSDLVLGGSVETIELSAGLPAPGANLFVTGWGSTSEGGSVSPNLRGVQVNAINRTVCALQYSDFIEVTPCMLCAGVAEGGKDACHGDAGGPLLGMVTGKLVGITSGGLGCGRADYPGVYASVAVGKAWIENILYLFS